MLLGSGEDVKEEAKGKNNIFLALMFQLSRILEAGKGFSAETKYFSENILSKSKAR